MNTDWEEIDAYHTARIAGKKDALEAMRQGEPGKPYILRSIPALDELTPDQQERMLKLETLAERNFGKYPNGKTDRAIDTMYTDDGVMVHVGIRNGRWDFTADFTADNLRNRADEQRRRMAHGRKHEMGEFDAPDTARIAEARRKLDKPRGYIWTGNSWMKRKDYEQALRADGSSHSLRIISEL